VSDADLLLEMRPWLRAEAAFRLGWERSRHTEDLAQEGWIAVWKALPDYPAGRAEELRIPWCKTVARNRMLNWIRDELLAPTRGEDNSTLVDDMATVWEGAQAAHEVDRSYHDGEIAAALQQLTLRQRDYVVARYWHGMSAKELDAHFGVTNCAAAYWNTRVRSGLAEKLGHLASV
jgi:RNA polymerase sigma factor (sigma-70 family)